MTATATDTSVWRATGAPLIPATAPGPLTGYTVAVKDLYALAGWTVGAGVPEYGRDGASAAAHAAAPARLLARGAAITGIAHTDQFAYSLTGANSRYGMPINPAAPDRIPGGSSSGPAVAVARGEADVGLGTDTAGSVRVPASYQGLWGIRTTHGRADTAGLLGLARSFDTVGWLTRDAETLDAVAACLLGDDHVDRSPVGTRASRTPEAALAHPPVRTASAGELVVDPTLCAMADPPIAEAVAAFARAAGSAPVSVDAEPDWAAAFRTVQAHEAWAEHGRWVAAHPGVLDADVAARFAYAATVTTRQAAAAREVLAGAAERIGAVLGERVLILPATATTAPPRDGGPAVWEAARARTLLLTCLASLAGRPAVTAPLGRHDGAPFGVCLVGPPGADRALIRLARAAVAAGDPLHSEDRS